jgi:transcriptional regulator GlxA family with amidase domain
MQIAIPLFDRFTALDAVGPYEVLSRLPGAQVEFIAAEPGVIRTETRMLGLEATRSLEEVPSPEVVVVPGGIGSRTAMHDARLLDWVRAAHAGSSYTTSVCTGALILSAAGVLDGLEATTHWLSLDRLDRPVRRRVVEQGKVFTAAGVSAGIDMALTLAARIAGDAVAQAIQLGIEYDPQPPFSGGSPDKAPPEVMELVMAAQRAEEAEAA